MSNWYDRDGKAVVTAKLGSKLWEKQMRKMEKKLSDRSYKVVKQDYTKNKKWWVSTVWLGIDHGWGDGPPQIFETMVFEVKDDVAQMGHDEQCERYATEKEALVGHNKVLRKWEKKDVNP